MALPETIDHVSVKNTTAELAMELAAKLMPMPEILKRFGLNTKQLKTLLKDPAFSAQVRTSKQQWLAAGNAKERIRVKAGIATEDSIATLYQIANDADVSPSSRIEAVRQLAELADAKPRRDMNEGAGGPVFAISINVPNAEPVTFEASGPALTQDDTSGNHE